MFKCRGCEALKSENERLHALVARLLDKVAGPESPDADANEDLAQPPPIEVEKDEDGNIIAEHFRYGV